MILLVVAIGGQTIWRLTARTWTEIEKLAIANADSSQWSLAQLEVEYLALENATLAYMAGRTSDLGNIRRRFDVFFSRIDTLSYSQHFAGVRSSDMIGDYIAQNRAFLDTYVPVIDGSDETLATALPGMFEDMQELHQGLRATSLEGVRVLAIESQDQRTAVEGALRYLGTIAIVLVGVLFAGVALLSLIVRNSQRKTEEIEQTQSRLQAIISTSIDAVLVVGKSGRVIDYNGAAERIFGYSRSEAIGVDIAELIIPDHLRELHEAGMHRYLSTGQKRVVGKGLVRLEAKHKDGTLFPVELSINAATSRESGGEFFVSYIRDISQRAAEESELIEARDRAVAGEHAKAKLLAVMSHEMRTPLNGVLGTLQLLADTDLNERQKRFVEVMDTSGKTLLEHVNNVLDISRVDAGKAELSTRAFDPLQVTKDIVRSLENAAQKRGNKLKVTALAEIGTVTGDEARLRQILFNLLGNAIKFTENGRVSVEVDRDPETKNVEFRVIDTGIGISPENTDRIFDDFITLDTSYNREVEGTGLGLGIVRRLVRLMGGEIGVVSEPGDGSVFWFNLPLSEAADLTQSDCDSASTSTLHSGQKAREILVVEDNEINRMIVREMLLQSGSNVVEANDGEEGVQKAAQGQFDLIFMDISMPKLDGIAATRMIRNGDGPNAHTPIVALTAHALADDIQKFRDAGMNDVLTKPLSREKLTKVLEKTDGYAPQEDKSNSVVRELIETMGAEGAHKLRVRACSEVKSGLEQLQQDVGANVELSRIKDLAHKLAGTAGIVGFMDTRKALGALETATGNGNRSQLASLAKIATLAFDRETADISGA
ncbi:ATP-binding protein [Celeribacter arenosi]|uniref:histidine kinase n=1 Tax=Celeribacter arenosi TaxID=792649 RepID=A0ABP7K1V0_9RHOB